jgi:hypothetical protein
MRSILKQLLISVSLANLCFLSVWKTLNSSNSQPYYLGDGDPLKIALAALIGMSALASAYGIAFWLGGRLRRASFRAWAERLFLLSLIVPLNGVRDNFPALNLPHMTHYLGKPVLVVLAALAFIAAGVVLIKWHRTASRIALTAAVIMSPFCFMTYFKVSWYIRQSLHIARRPPTHESVAPASRSPNRILWFVYDEMDQRLTFAERPAGIELPNFERLKDESIYASNAISACRDTREAMPSLMTGNIVAEVSPMGSDELMLRYSAQQRYVSWSSEETVFSTAKALGYRTAVIGWYHPYSRVIGHTLDYCVWVPWAFAADHNTILSCLLYEYQSILPVAAQGLRYREHVARYLRIQQAAEKVVLDPKYSFVLVHWPVPHMPFIYDRNKGYRWIVSWDGYFGNMVLADKSFGEIRKGLELNGLWDASTIIVTSDHFWRDSNLYDSRVDDRVPFIIKLPGKSMGLKYERVFNTIVTRELLEGFMKNSLSTADQVTRWLETKSRVQGRVAAMGNGN